MTLGGQGRIALVLAVLVAGVACGNGTRGGTGTVPVVTLGKTPSASGDVQTGVVGTALLNLLRVVVEEDGVPQPGVEVLWSVETGGGSVTAADTTNLSGVAVATWTLGTIAGNQSVTATLAGATGSPVAFVATATPGPATGLNRLAGDNQSTVPTGVFPNPLRVKVVDQYGNPVQGTTVDWTTTGGLTVTPSTISDNKGESSNTAAAGGTTGPGTVVATLSGTATSGTFHFTVIAPAREVTVGQIFFRSVTNATEDPAVDTIQVGETVLWRVASGTHTVRSINGPPSFSSSGDLDPLSAPTYFITFPNAGTYEYDCAKHGAAFMSGRVVVQ